MRASLSTASSEPSTPTIPPAKMPSASMKESSSANKTQSSLLQVLNATLDSEPQDMGFKIMKKLSAPENFRYAAGTRRVEVAIPQSSGRVYVRRRSVKTLKAHLNKQDPDPGDEREYDYTFWLAQCVHYGLAFPATSLDARQMFKKAIAGGLKKEPFHLRKLAKELKKHREKSRGDGEDGEERTMEASRLRVEESDQVVDNSEVFPDQSVDMKTPDPQQEPPQHQQTSNVSVVIPRGSSNASGIEPIQQSMKSIWDLPSDSEDGRTSQNYNREVRGETYFDAALVEHVNYLYNEAEFDESSEFENESTASETTSLRRSCSRVTRSSALKDNAEGIAREIQLSSSPNPRTLSDLDRAIEVAAIRKKGKIKTKRRSKPITGSSSRGGHDEQGVVSARSTILRAKPTKLKTKFQSASSCIHTRLDQSRLELPSTEPQSAMIQPQALTNLVDIIEGNRPFLGITQTRSPSDATKTGERPANNQRHSKSPIPPSPEVHIISSDSDSGSDQTSSHTFVVAVRSRSPSSIYTPGATTIAKQRSKFEALSVSATSPPDAYSRTAEQPPTISADLPESHPVPHASAGESRSSTSEPTDDENSEQKQDRGHRVRDLRRRQEKWRENLRKLEEEIEARRIDLEEKERWGEKIRVWQRAAEERMIREKAAAKDHSAMAHTSTDQKQNVSQKQEGPRRARKRARTYHSLPEQGDHFDETTTSIINHNPLHESDSGRPQKKARSANTIEAKKQQEAGASQSLVKRVVTPKAKKENAGKKGQSVDGSSQKAATTDKSLTGDDKAAAARRPKRSPNNKPPEKTPQSDSKDTSAIPKPGANLTSSKRSSPRDKALSDKHTPPAQLEELQPSERPPEKQEWRRITYTSNPMAGRRPGSYRLDSVAPQHFRDLMTMEVPILGPGQRPEDLPPPRMVPNPDYGDNPPLELQWVERHTAFKRKVLDDFKAKIPKGSRFGGLEPRVVSDARGVRVEW